MGSAFRSNVVKKVTANLPARARLSSSYFGWLSRGVAAVSPTPARVFKIFTRSASIELCADCSFTLMPRAPSFAGKSFSLEALAWPSS
eukprot:481730-Prymnesium_polylepis.1